MIGLRRVSLLLISASLPLLGGDPYRSAGFVSWPDSVKMGALSSVAVAANGHVYVLHRGDPPLLEFDAQRKFIRGWGSGLFKVAHGLRIDGAGNIWTTDNGNHVVRKFSAAGELLQTIGEVDVPGGGRQHFRSPDDVVFNQKGELFVADSGNGRIVHLNGDGTYISEWGTKGEAPGQFKMAHGLAIDSEERIYVADRGNNRVQVFTPDGTLKAVWSGFGNPFGLLVVGPELLVSDGDAHKIFHLDRAGRVAASWGGPAVLELPHFMAIDREGNLLLAEVNGKRVQIFSKERHAK
jgi:DNA-binding beta-propeller fold protein YncE